jgi:hypothetical protein
MADLEIIIDSHDNRNTNANALSHINTDSSVKSPNRKENILPPPPPVPTILINKSLNGGLFNSV